VTIEVRKGQGDVKLPRDEFERRLRERFVDPAFAGVSTELDRVVVCAHGGNPDPTTTHGKKPDRLFSVVVHGDTEGAETLRRSLTDWLTDMDLVPAAPSATFDRSIGYHEPYATSHAALDRDTAVQDEVRNAARTLIESVKLARAGQLPRPDRNVHSPRPK